MIIELLQYFNGKGWSSNNFPDLDSENTLILVFAAPEFINSSEPIQELAKAYPQSIIIGCSGAGEISGSTISDHSLSIAITKFEKTQLKSAMVAINDATDSYQAGKEIVSQLNHKNLRGIFVLSEGLHINGSELTRGLNSINKKEVVITGGLAGDGSHFKQTWVIMNKDILFNKVVAVGFYGNHIHIGHGSKGGWDIFGPERRITRSKNNVLYELDGKPALELYKEYLGDKAQGLPAMGLLFPLAIRKDLDDKRQLVRTILAVDEKENSLTFAGDVPMGYLAKLMRANFDRLITGAKEAGILITRDNAKFTMPMLLIAVSCVGRRLLLGERTPEETESVLEIFPKGTQLVGFYSYGELSPYTKGDCDLHNQTMTLTSLSEEK